MLALKELWVVALGIVFQAALAGVMIWIAYHQLKWRTLELMLMLVMGTLPVAVASQSPVWRATLNKEEVLLLCSGALLVAGLICSFVSSLIIISKLNTRKVEAQGARLIWIALGGSPLPLLVAILLAVAG